MNIIKNIFKHRHKWVTTHENRYGLPTRQFCVCGVSREVKTISQTLTYKWVQSDGVESKPINMGEVNGA